MSGNKPGDRADGIEAAEDLMRWARALIREPKPRLFSGDDQAFLALDNQGLSIPLTPAELEAWAGEIRAMLERLRSIPGDLDEADAGFLRAIDSHRPHRPLFRRAGLMRTMGTLILIEAGLVRTASPEALDADAILAGVAATIGGPGTG